MDILIDFDGTCVTHDFPGVGEDIGAAAVLHKLITAGHNLILFTMRSDLEQVVTDIPGIHPIGGNYESEAVDWFKQRGILLYGVGSHPTQHKWTNSRKAYGHLIIDDTALGVPLIHGVHSRPYVDWQAVEKILIEKGIL